MAIGNGADAVGLVGKMPSGPGPIDDELIKEIVVHVPPPVASFLLTSEQSAAGIIAHLRRTHANSIQIVDELTEGTYMAIREALPAVRIVQVLHVQDAGSIETARQLQSQVDAFLLDSGNPNAAIKTLGGTGNVHDWQLSREIVKSVAIPVFLAGGLNAGNVRQAIETVQPFGVDICSGVRTGGKLDEAKLKSFIQEVNSIQAAPY